MITEEKSREGLVEALEQTRRRTLALVETLDDQQLDVPYHPGVNPPLWETGHSAFFYEVFVLSQDGGPNYDPSMDDLWDSFHIEHRDRWRRDLFPGRAATLSYFNTIYDRVAKRIRSKPLSGEDHYLYRYAIYHQNMHIESLIWCRQTVGFPPPPSYEAGAPDAIFRAETNELKADALIPAGRYVMGMPGSSPDFATMDFGFDNEKPRFEVELPAFAISRTLVSNGEFREFVDAGGYQAPEFWSFGGRKWLEKPYNRTLVTGATEDAMTLPTHPIYWQYRDAEWQEKHFDRWHPLDPSAPVTHVTYWEAEAFCQWAGRRLPSEAEWEAAALDNRPGQPFNRFPWGNGQPRPDQADMDGRWMARQPVGHYANGVGRHGCRQMIGSVWEWTTDQFLPYDGFKVDVYPFMSTLQFGDHKVTKGGSCATSSMLIRGTYRQAYLPERNDTYTGFRTCAR
ncbi:selenoneine synthase SenA [Marinobacter salicampi]|uniref:selenoneine synthase SenA n=1 Tax=Marinobacter salicampi TaxID=435907 RepID=UPI001407E4FC|nr:selenoneine synthase SenA [Marinobacter salicampi]